MSETEIEKVAKGWIRLFGSGAYRQAVKFAERSAARGRLRDEDIWRTIAAAIKLRNQCDPLREGGSRSAETSLYRGHAHQVRLRAQAVAQQELRACYLAIAADLEKLAERYESGSRPGKR